MGKRVSQVLQQAALHRTGWYRAPQYTECVGKMRLSCACLQRKKRTHVPQGDVSSKVPRSFVMERGAVGKAVGQLVVDVRQVMEPHTASKLKVARGAAQQWRVMHYRECRMLAIAAQ